ncbi:MAG: tetratricopeptide repeat protein [Bacteroidales bacterium]|nr:tetratricopeptide repeat protein [Bacteroidales bacterium]
MIHSNSLRVQLLFVITIFFFFQLKTLKPQGFASDSLLANFDKMKSSEKIDTLTKLSKHFYASNPDMAINYGELAIELAKKTNNVDKQAYSLRNIGLALYMKGERKKALEYLTNSYKLYETLGNKQKILQLKNNIGMVYNKLGEYDKSIGALLEAEKIYNTLLTKDMDTSTLICAADIFSNLGSTYLRIRGFSKCLYYYDKAQEIYIKLNNNADIASTYNNIGNVYFRRNIFDTAKINYQKALAIYKSGNNLKGLAHVYCSIGNIYWSYENYDSAAYWISKSLSNYKKAKNISGIAAMLNNLGGLYIHLKEYEKSEQMLNESLELAKNIGSKIRIQQTFLALSDLYEAKGNYKKSRNYLLQYSEMKDTIYNENSSRQIAEMQTKYETEKKEKELEIKTLKLSNQQKFFYYIIAFIVLVVVVAGLLFNRYKLRQKAYKTNLEKQNLEVEKRLLRSQMNPHFIFNSLNSIRSYILGNEAKSAAMFLDKFANLMRSILDNSRKSFISLEDDIKSLRLNLELEKNRFKDKFDFEINLAPDIDPEMFYIPPMLIQPFVENAIKHGIAKKENIGLIKINYFREHDVIKCIVADNGIGREANTHIQKKNGWQSLGSKLTEERLELLNEKLAGNISIQINDLKDEDGLPEGTEVVLHIPFEKD